MDLFESIWIVKLSEPALNDGLNVFIYIYIYINRYFSYSFGWYRYYPYTTDGRPICAPGNDLRILIIDVLSIHHP